MRSLRLSKFMCGLGFMALGCLGLASDKVAVVIGVNQYSDASIAPLRFAKADAVEVSSVLTTNGWDVITITTDESGSTGSATASGIQAALKQVAKRGKLDSFLFYFCGHGFSNSKKVGYLALGDTTLSNLESTALAIPSLIDASGTIDATHKSFFFDACRNDPSRAIGVETKTMDKDLFESFRSLSEETSAAVFLSCKQGEKSYENDALKHGVFTYAVLEGLKGEAAVDGTVTANTLMGYISKRVPELEKAQTPFTVLAGSAPAEYSKGSKSSNNASKRATPPVAKKGFALVELVGDFPSDSLKSTRAYIGQKELEVIDDRFIYVPHGKHQLRLRTEGHYTYHHWNGKRFENGYPETSGPVELVLSSVDYNESKEPTRLVFGLLQLLLRFDGNQVEKNHATKDAKFRFDGKPLGVKLRRL